MNSKGEFVTLKKSPNVSDDFYGAVVNLGALGIVTWIKLEVVPAFQVRQFVYTWLPLASLSSHFDGIFSAAYSVSLFTDWSNSEAVNQVRLKYKVDTKDANFIPSKEFYGAELSEFQRHPVEGISPENCTDAVGVPGPSYERLPHFKLGFTPSVGEELQSEFFVPRMLALQALSAVSNLGPKITPCLVISEIRSIAQDNFWMSPCYRGPAIGIHFTWKADWSNVQHAIPLVEEALYPFGAVPHFGKLFSMKRDQFSSQFPKFTEFQQLMKKFDPEGKFSNYFIHRNITGQPHARL